MTGIIWYKNMEVGLGRFIKLVREYGEVGIEGTSVVNRHEARCEFQNGDFWKLVRATEGNRGECCNISLIEESITDEFVDRIIIPSTKARPYRAFEYYT